MDEYGPDDSGLEVSLSDMLRAFDLAQAHTPSGKNRKQYLENRCEIAECIIDWALTHNDRGLQLLELMARDVFTGPIILGPPK